MNDSVCEYHAKVLDIELFLVFEVDHDVLLAEHTRDDEPTHAALLQQPQTDVSTPSLLHHDDAVYFVAVGSDMTRTRLDIWKAQLRKLGVHVDEQFRPGATTIAVASTTLTRDRLATVCPGIDSVRRLVPPTWVIQLLQTKQVPLQCEWHGDDEKEAAAAPPSSLPPPPPPLAATGDQSPPESEFHECSSTPTATFRETERSQEDDDDDWAARREKFYATNPAMRAVHAEEAANPLKINMDAFVCTTSSVLKSNVNAHLTGPFEQLVEYLHVENDEWRENSYKGYSLTDKGLYKATRSKGVKKLKQGPNVICRDEKDVFLALQLPYKLMDIGDSRVKLTVSAIPLFHRSKSAPVKGSANPSTSNASISASATAEPTEPSPSSSVYIVSSAWYSGHLAKDKACIGPISNHTLVSFFEGKLRPNPTVRSQDYSFVDEREWLSLVKTYGGGPTITTALPSSKWIISFPSHQLKHQEHAHLVSSYADTVTSVAIEAKSSDLPPAALLLARLGGNIDAKLTIPDRDLLLANVLADVLVQATESPSDKIWLIDATQVSPSSDSFSPFDVPRADLPSRVLSFLVHPKRGVLSFVYSLMLTRGVSRLQDDMDDVESSLTSGQFGHGSQELLNLMLTGRATSNVFDGVVPMGDSGLVLRGVQSRAQVGYLTHLEALRYCTVGTFLKSPIFPVWVLGSTSHFTVLFATDASLCTESASDALLATVQRAFQSFDTMGNGYIPIDALGQVLAKLHVDPAILANEFQLGRLYSKLQVPGAGIVLWEDFWRVVSILLDTNDLQQALDGKRKEGSSRPRSDSDVARALQAQFDADPTNDEQEQVKQVVLYHVNGLVDASKASAGKFPRCVQFEATIPTKNRVGYSVPMVDTTHTTGGHGCPIEDVLQTKWPGISVNWHGQRPPTLD
ncbi:hypothetical protein B5M09_007006 [Aphanomyces astaci]|uniref:ubiquitinyl hydrolase 1 n=1 Tax=Aphanomyces astaci TaxID=112090 RepID=A0A425D832_APHAT|nr:hypothetical protein B5M09_007006 [Aphanomyces astaci]